MVHNFRIGDKIRVIKNHYVYKEGEEFTVKKVLDATHTYDFIEAVEEFRNGCYLESDKIEFILEPNLVDKIKQARDVLVSLIKEAKDNGLEIVLAVSYAGDRIDLRITKTEVLLDEDNDMPF